MPTKTRACHPAEGPWHKMPCPRRRGHATQPSREEFGFVRRRRLGRRLASVGAAAFEEYKIARNLERMAREFKKHQGDNRSGQALSSRLIYPDLKSGMRSRLIFFALKPRINGKSTTMFYSIKCSLLTVVAVASCGHALAQEPAMPRFKAVAFDYDVKQSGRAAEPCPGKAVNDLSIRARPDPLFEKLTRLASAEITRISARVP
jgi:hypothetical protein